VACSLLCLTSCGEGEGSSRESAETSSAPVADGVEAGPLDAIRYWSSQDAHTVGLAVYAATRDCMATKGFEYLQPPPEPLPPESLNRYSLDVDEASAHGYLGPESGVAPAPALPDPTIAEAYLRALNEDDPTTMVATDASEGRHEYHLGGCNRDALDRIFLDYEAYETTRLTMDDLIATASAQIAVDESWKTTVAAWAKCMNDLGYSVSTPDDLPPDWFQDTDTARRIAVSDANCRNEVRLAPTWGALAKKYQEAVLEDWPGFMDEYQSVRAQILQRAQDEITK
jgi:hypothetical protein